jgi:hypothetical protein
MENKEKGPESADKRHHRRRLLNLPIEYSSADKNIGRGGFTLNVSEEGLSVDLPEKLEVGRNLELTLHGAHGSIKMVAKVIWTSPPARRGETHRSGMSITKLSLVNRLKWRMLLAYANA